MTNTLQTSSDRPGVALFLSIHELGWKTWARQLETHSPTALENAIHIPLATPLAVRLLARPLPWPVRRAMLSERGYFERTIKTHLARIHAQHPISVITVSSQRLGPILMPFCKQHDIPLAICLDTTGPAYLRDLLRQPPAPTETWAEERAIYQFADLLVPWSSWARTSLIEDFAIHPEKIQLTPPGVSFDHDIHPPAQLQPNALPKILFVGNDWHRKGGHRLVEWHQAHFQQTAELHIASAKAPRQSLPNVTFHGAVPHARLLSELLPQMDLFCLPTSHDMSPFAIAEAQAAGLPVVSSHLAGIPDLVQHDRTGYLIPHEEDAAFIAALRLLITTPDLRLKMSIAAKKHAAESLDARVVFPRLMHRLAACTAGKVMTR